MPPMHESRSFRPQGREAPVQLYLSGASGDASALVGCRAANLPLVLNLIPVTEWIDRAEVAGAAAAVVQVDADTPASIKRFEKLAGESQTPLLAACYEPPLALVRSLIRLGAHDVLPLPLALDDLETALAPLAERRSADAADKLVRNARLVSVVKSRGGAGATALLTQLAVRFAERETKAGREACLIDLDLQYGDAAFQLGLQPSLTLSDLVEAGSRLDGELMRQIVTRHHSGLNVIAAPTALLPLDTLSNEAAIAIVERAEREFGTVFLDLPANWTNWSMSLLARSDCVLLVTELSIPSLNRARRQLDLIEAQELGALDVRVVVNRAGGGLFKPLRTEHVEQALGRPAAFLVGDDRELMDAAIDRGVPIGELKRKSGLGRDLDAIDAGLVHALRLER
nr:AAA family ATPase [Sphingomonas ginkgonis]